VLSIVGRQAAAARGEHYDEDADAAMRVAVEEQIEAESQAFVLSGRIYDDGVIDPRDTRSVLGMCLSVIDGAPGRAAGQDSYPARSGLAGQLAPAGAGRYGVFRM
jgi:acetyl-CoA carboxylase carboxyltransferase component